MQYKENANAALALLNGTDYALDEMTKVLHRLSELAVQGANGPLNETSPLKPSPMRWKNYVIIYTILPTPNRRILISLVGKKRIGPRMNLIRVQPRMITWHGSSNPLKAEVGTGIMMEITVTGDRVFFGDSADPANDFFAQLDEFIGHLRSEDFDAISNTDIQNIQDRLDQVLRGSVARLEPK